MKIYEDFFIMSSAAFSPTSICLLGLANLILINPSLERFVPIMKFRKNLDMGAMKAFALLSFFHLPLFS